MTCNGNVSVVVLYMIPYRRLYTVLMQWKIPCCGVSGMLVYEAGINQFSISLYIANRPVDAYKLYCKHITVHISLQRN